MKQNFRVGGGGRTCAAILLLLAWFGVLGGCGSSVTGPDGEGEKTGAGIEVRGAGTESFQKVDGAWSEVNNCWGINMNGSNIVVTVMTPEFYDKSGLGVIRYSGELYYGVRVGNKVYVAPDMAALRHEFSHIVGEKTTGHLVDNGASKCWL